MTTVTLKDGYEVLKASFEITRMTIQNLQDTHLEAFIDLVEKCRNPNFIFSRTEQGDSSIPLMERFLITKKNEIINEDVRRIVLNSIEGSGRTIQLVNPIKATQM